MSAKALVINAVVILAVGSFLGLIPAAVASCVTVAFVK